MLSLDIRAPNSDTKDKKMLNVDITESERNDYVLAALPLLVQGTSIKAQLLEDKGDQDIKKAICRACVT